MALQRRNFAQALQAFPTGRDVYISGGEVNLPVNVRILATYLPNLVTVYGGTFATAIDLNALVFRHPQLHLSNRHRESMLDTLEVVIRSLSRNVDRSEATSLELTTWLEKSLRAGQTSFRVTFARFTTLAYLAKLTISTRIFALLSQFFVKHASTLFAEEGFGTDYAVLEWSMCIVMYFSAAERVGCIKELIENRHHILQDLRTASKRRPELDIRLLVRVVEDVIARMAVSQNQRPRVSRWHTSDAVDFRGRERHRNISLDSDDDVYQFRPTRQTSQSPLRRRRSSAVPRGFGPDDLLSHDKQLVMRRRARSQDNDGAYQLLRRLEDRIEDLEEAVTFVAAKRLNMDGFDVRRKEPWDDRALELM